MAYALGICLHLHFVGGTRRLVHAHEFADFELRLEVGGREVERCLRQGLPPVLLVDESVLEQCEGRETGIAHDVHRRFWHACVHAEGCQPGLELVLAGGHDLRERHRVGVVELVDEQVEGEEVEVRRRIGEEPFSAELGVRKGADSRAA